MITSSSTDTRRDDIQRQFASTRLADDALSECEAICQSFSLSAEDLYIKWQRMLINNYGGNTSVQPTRDRLLQLRHEVQEEFERQGRAKSASSQNTLLSQRNRLSKSRGRLHDKNTISGILKGISTTPKSKRLADPVTTPKSHNRVGILKAEIGNSNALFSPGSLGSPNRQSPSAVRFMERQNADKTETVFNSHLPVFDSVPDLEALAIHIFDSESATPSAPRSGENDDQGEDGGIEPTRKKFRYMFEKIRDNADGKYFPGPKSSLAFLLAREFKKAYGIESLGNPAYAHQGMMPVVGRICNEVEETPDNKAPHLNDKSVVLETSRRVGGGKRVLLNLKATPSFAFFPGQIVAMKGKNLDGKEFTVAEVQEIPLPSERLTDGVSQPAHRFTMSIAAGPFTLSDNLEYDTL
ncbi:DNA-directed DNA polymerase alpha subunit pol12, partial [Spiromyces aspiralis]